MTRSEHRSAPSRAVFFALLAAGATLMIATPASARKRKSTSTADSAAAATDQETPTTGAEDQKPVPQATDEEKPKAPLNVDQEAPKTDSLGHVHFASPNGEGLGRVVVNGPASDKIKVFLEGRLFGTAPITIYSVPKGDYIIEGVYPSGKSAGSKPVTVSEGQETTVALGAAAAKVASSGGPSSSSVMTPLRTNLMYGFLVGAVVGIGVGTTFGILDWKAENDYQNSSGSQSERDDIQQRGQRDAQIADAGWVLAAVGLVGAGVCAIPMIFGGNEKTSAPQAPSGTPSAFLLTPVASPHMMGGAFSMRF